MNPENNVLPTGWNTCAHLDELSRVVRDGARSVGGHLVAHELAGDAAASLKVRSSRSSVHPSSTTPSSMTSSATYTQAWTSTVTEARVRVVMWRRCLPTSSPSPAPGLLYGYLGAEVARRPELRPRPERRSKVADSSVPDPRTAGRARSSTSSATTGRCSKDAGSGGVDYHTFPVETRVTVTFRWRDGVARRQRRPRSASSWRSVVGRSNGSLIEGEVVRDRAYSTAGYGVVRNKVGNWG